MRPPWCFCKVAGTTAYQKLLWPLGNSPDRGLGGVYFRIMESKPKSDIDDSNSLPLEIRRGLYETIFRRRDMREFRPDPIPDEVLARVLVAAHHAASVGFTQPWDFIIVRDLERRREVKR